MAKSVDSANVLSAAVATSSTAKGKKQTYNCKVKNSNIVASVSLASACSNEEKRWDILWKND